MFCVNCGQEKKIFKDGVCCKCFVKEHTFTQGPQLLDVYQCPHCNLFKWKNIWIDAPFEDVVFRLITEHFEISNDLTDIQILIDDCTWKDKKAICSISISGEIGTEHVTEHHILEIRLKKLACETCSKQFSGYFEAIIQIRATNRKIGSDELNTVGLFIEKMVKQMRDNGNRNIFIADSFDEKGGMDYYLSDRGCAFIIAKKVLERYGGELKQSSSNAGMKDSKQLYRMTYLVRLPPYREGDTFRDGKKYHLILGVSANKVHTIDLATGNDKIFEAKQLQTIRTIGGHDLLKEMIVVSQSDDEIQVMNPTTYALSYIRKPRDCAHVADGGTVFVVRIDEHMFLAPQSLQQEK